MKKNELPVHHLVVVNLAEVNRQKREKLRKIAQGFNCELVQVYDRPWFANQFRENPDWRRKILGLEGGPFSFSREPRGARPDERQLPTVGRDALIKEVNDGATDVILFGVPGAGKSHVASKVDGALFLERQPTPERLLDDLISTKPVVVVVDDAGARLQDLDLLLHLRHSEGIHFRIAATCWPHETHHVADLLANSVPYEVDRLTREELGTLLRERGITRLSVRVHLLAQADGRPAWALNLADLLIRDSDWSSVWTGRALREQIFAFLRRSNASEDAVDVLGTISLLGQVDDHQLRRVADLLQLRQSELVRLIRSVAIAGLVDVQEMTQHDPLTGRTETTQRYQVQPSIIAASVASEVFFAGSPAPVRLREVQDAFPELAAAITQAQIYTKLLGATHPVVPTSNELVAVLPSAVSAGQHAELLRSFGQLGPSQAQFVVDIHAARVTDAIRAGRPTSAESESKQLAARVSEALDENTPSAMLSFARMLTLIEGKGWSIQPAVKELVEEVRNARSGDQPQLADLMKLIEAMKALTETELTTASWTALACEVLTPTFDGNYMNPEAMQQFVLQSFTWAATHMEELYHAIEPTLGVRAPHMTPCDLLKVLDLLEKWVRIADGFDVPFGGKIDEWQERAGERIARSIALTIAPVISTPGVRARFNRAALSLGIELAEPDKLFAVLTAESQSFRNYKEVQQRKVAALDAALAPFQRQAPDVLMTWLKDSEAEIRIGSKSHSGAQQVFTRLAHQPDPEPEKWLTAAIAHDLTASAGSLIEVCVRKGMLTQTMTEQLLDDPAGRPGLIFAVLGFATDTELVNTVVEQLTCDDIQLLETSYILKDVPPTIRHALFTHLNPDVRGTAAALWAAEWSYDKEIMPGDPEWLNAIKDFTVQPRSRHDHMQQQALKALVAASPAVFADLLVKHVDALDTCGGYDDFDEWEESAMSLGAVDRRSLWNRVRESKLACELFWVLAGNDPDWIAETVGDSAFDVPLRELLGAFRFVFGRRFPLETLARMLLPLKWEPDDLLRTLEVGSFSGEEHDRYAKHLNTLRDLAASDDTNIARLGKRGVEIYEPKLKRALTEARQAAVRGTQHF